MCANSYLFPWYTKPPKLQDASECNNNLSPTTPISFFLPSTGIHHGIALLLRVISGVCHSRRYKFQPSLLESGLKHLPTLNSLSPGLRAALPLVELVFDGFAGIPYITCNSACSSQVLSDIDKRPRADLTSFNINVAFGACPLVPVGFDVASNICHIIYDVSCCVYQTSKFVKLVCLDASGVDITFGVLPLVPVGFDVASNICNIIYDVSCCVYKTSKFVKLVCLDASGVDITFGVLPLVPVGFDVASNICNTIYDVSCCVYKTSNFVKFVRLDASVIVVSSPLER